MNPLTHLKTLTTAILAVVTAAAVAEARPRQADDGVPPTVHYFETVSMMSSAAESGLGIPGATELAFAVLGRQFDLKLEAHDLYAPGATVVWVDDAGEVVEPAANGMFLRGRVEGDADSWVRLTQHANGELSGIIAASGETYFLEPARRFFGAAAAGETLAYALSDTESDWTPDSCATAHAPRKAAKKKGALPGFGRGRRLAAHQAVAELAQALAAGSLRRAQIGLIADYEYFSQHGADAAADLAEVLNAVDGVYTNEVGVTLELLTTIVHTSVNDPFSNTTVPNTLLNEASTYRNNNDNSPGQLLYGADLAHLVTGRNLDGNVIGIAWLTALCSSSYGVGVSQDYTSLLYNLTLLMAHEMGHNFAAPHDNQGGSACAAELGIYIMNPSLSGSLQQQFSPCSKTLINQHVANSGCLDTVDPGPTNTPTLTPTRTPTHTPTAPPLGVPAITQPGVNQQMTTGGITFAWSQVANATGYELLILNGQSQTVFSGSLVGGASTSSLIVLPSNGSYTFRVRACINAACGSYASRAFSINLTTPASAPTITFPAIGATLTTSVHNFTWTAVVAGGGLPVFYELELIDLDGADTELRITVPDPTLNTVVRLHSGNYRARVRACQAGCGPWSTAHDFTGAVPSQPGSAPTVAGATLDGSDLTTSWTPIGGAEWYQVYVIQPPPAGPGGGALTVAAREVVGTTTVLPIPTGAASVIVAACSGNGCGPFSGAMAILSSAPNPDLPNLGTPLGGSVVQGPTVLFTWNRIPGDNGSNTLYRLYVQDLSRGTVAFDVHTTSNFYGGYFKAEGSRYDALVVANPGPSQVLGPATGFIVAGQSSAAPTMTTPAHNSTIGAGNVQLGWSPVPGATLYEYFVAIPGSATPPTRGVTPGTLVQVPLSAAGNAPTLHSAIVRACPGSCVAGSDAGWSPWSNVAGPGVTNFTVVP